MSGGRTPTSEGRLQRIGYETLESRTSDSQDRAWSVLSYIFYRIEQHINKDNKDELHFGKFLSYKPMRIHYNKTFASYDPNTGVLPRRELKLLHEWLSIGNLTFYPKSEIAPKIVNQYGFGQTKTVLSERSNASLKLNQQICQKESWDWDQIRERQKKLCRYFCEIWPDHGSFLKKLAEQSGPKTYEGTLKTWKNSRGFYRN